MKSQRDRAGFQPTSDVAMEERAFQIFVVLCLAFMTPPVLIALALKFRRPNSYDALWGTLAAMLISFSAVYMAFSEIR